MDNFRSPIGVLAILFLFRTVNSTARCMNVSIITPGFFDLNIPMSLAYSAFAMEVAVERTKAKYPMLNITHTMDTDITSLSDFNFKMDDRFSKWYYKERNPNSLVAIITPSVYSQSLQFLLPQLDDVVVITSLVSADSEGIGGSALAVNGRSWITTTYSNSDRYADMFVKLLVKYSWYDVYLLADETAQPLHRGIPLQIRKRLRATGNFKITYRTFSSILPVDYPSVLQDFSKLSRIMIVCSLFGHIRKLLISGAKLNMTNGDYVSLRNTPASTSVSGAIHKLYHANSRTAAWQGLSVFLAMTPVSRGFMFDLPSSGAVVGSRRPYTVFPFTYRSASHSFFCYLASNETTKNHLLGKGSGASSPMLSSAPECFTDQKYQRIRDTVYLTLQPWPSKLYGKLHWKYGDDEDEIARQAFGSLLVMQPFEPVQLSNLTIPVWSAKYNQSFPGDREIIYMQLAIYAAVTAFAEVFDEVVATTQPANWTNGRVVTEKFKNRWFANEYGSIYIGSRFERLVPLVVSHFDNAEVMEDFLIHEPTATTFHELKNISWPNGKWPPPNAPPCGYLDAGCSPGKPSIQILVAGPCAVFLVIGIVTASLFFGRKLWISHYYGMLLLDKVSFTYTETPPQSYAFLSKSADESPKIGRFQSELVWLERVADHSIFDGLKRRSLEMNVQALARIHHRNLGTFYGVLSSKLETCLVYEYGVRDTLRHLLDADHSVVKDDFLSSIIWDLISATAWLHRSAVNYHGSLSSFSVTINNRFCARVIHYGSNKIRRKLSEGASHDPKCTMDFPVLWSAPEVIEDPLHHGSRKADMYSLAIVILETFTKETPVSCNFAKPKDVIDAIEAVKDNPTASRIPLWDQVPSELQAILTRCTEALPERRPSPGQLAGHLQDILPVQSFFDAIASRLELYAHELERSVRDRTRLLVEERLKVDTILREILPLSVVKKLRDKLTVDAESFDHVTILFGDIPAFGAICGSCSPFEIVALLNQVYSACDALLVHFDVYKVETINDCYMVASGLPERNGQKHAGEIGRFGLTMMSLTHFKADTYVHPVRFRIGINSGPCVTGVVGQKMPRYCLFGDTVNTSSRMESHGEESRIHISESTKQFLDFLGGFITASRGLVAIKGKGKLETFWLTGLCER